MPKKSAGKLSQKWLLPVIILVAAIMVAVIFIFGKPSGPKPMPESISVSDAADLFSNGAFLLDVRQPEEWVAGHVEGAVLIPLGELQDRLSEIPTDTDVLIICRSGNRSSQAREILRAAGLDRSTSIAGGMNAWTAAGFPVVTGN